MWRVVLSALVVLTFVGLSLPTLQAAEKHNTLQGKVFKSGTNDGVYRVHVVWYLAQSNEESGRKKAGETRTEEDGSYKFTLDKSEPKFEITYKDQDGKYYPFVRDGVSNSVKMMDLDTIGLRKRGKKLDSEAAMEEIQQHLAAYEAITSNVSYAAEVSKELYSLNEQMFVKVLNENPFRLTSWRSKGISPF